MRTAHTADHRTVRADLRAQANPVRPGSAGVDDPGAFDTRLLPADLIAPKHTGDPTMTDVHGQHLGVITGDCTRIHGLYQPLRHESLRELALRILVTEDRPAAAGV